MEAMERTYLEGVERGVHGLGDGDVGSGDARQAEERESVAAHGDHDAHDVEEP